MSSFREIEEVFQGTKRHWVGSSFYVSNYFPEGKNLLKRFAPFILLDYAPPLEFRPSSTPRGVSAHPHRGFETITIALEGYIEHHDNVGEHGIIGPGDVQWMTAGSGILHKEYLEKNFNTKGGLLHMIQLWVNLPKKYKLDPPKYQELLKENMGFYKIPNNAGHVSVIAGDFKNIQGPASTFTPINIYTINLINQGSLSFREASDFNTGILILEGEIKVNDQICKNGDFILFKNLPGDIKLKSISENSMAIVFSGQTIDEPIVASGTFVMNSQEEIDKANEDYHKGNFGSLDF